MPIGAVSVGHQAVTAIVFSKDRALQLDAFLRSFERCVWPVLNVEVLYLATTARHEAAYQDVFRRHRCAYPRAQQDFRADVLSLVPDTGAVVLFVDDQVFVRPWRVESIIGLSLRLAPHLTQCYTADTAQPIPLFMPFMPDRFAWRWADGKGDWGYPLSLDGHVFDAGELRGWMIASDFQSPNALEAALQVFRPAFTDRLGVCYPHAIIVNVPWNSVQTSQSMNRCGQIEDADTLLRHWEDGQRMNIEPIMGVMNRSAHQEFPLMLEPQ